MFRAVDADHARGYGSPPLPPERAYGALGHAPGGRHTAARIAAGWRTASKPSRKRCRVSVRFSPRLLPSRSRIGTWLRSIAQAGSPRSLEEIWPVDAVVRPLWPIVSKGPLKNNFLS